MEKKTKMAVAAFLDARRQQNESVELDEKLETDGPKRSDIKISPAHVSAHLKPASAPTKKYINKKVKERQAMNKKNDPGAAKQGKALSVLDKAKALKKAHKKGLKHVSPYDTAVGKKPSMMQKVQRGMAEGAMDESKKDHPAAAELHAHAMKSGGNDKKSFQVVAGHLNNHRVTGNPGTMAALAKHIKGMDTGPRDKAMKVIHKHDPAMHKSLVRKAGLAEDVEVAEAVTTGDLKAQAEGKKAAKAGQKYESNPYEKGSSRHLQWSKGHNAARARKLGMKEGTDFNDHRNKPKLTQSDANKMSKVAAMMAKERAKKNKDK